MLTGLVISIEWRALIQKLILSIGMTLAAASPAGGAAETTASVTHWVPAVGDHFVVNVEQNIGYLEHTDGTALSFRVVTGQQRSVYYIGRSYYAATPVRSWSAESLDYKTDDRVTFGPTGRFFRLYNDGEATPYGIHGHRDADTMLASDNRYRSMGCIIVSEQILDIIEATYRKNGDILQVQTVDATKTGNDE